VRFAFGVTLDRSTKLEVDSAHRPEVLSEGAPPCHSTKKVPYDPYGIELRGSSGASDDDSLEAISGLLANKLDRLDSQVSILLGPS
jgi:hypothetical protein